MAQGEFLLLDPQLRDWVLLPIVAVMFLVSCFRHYLTKLISSETETQVDSHKEQQVLARSRVLRGNFPKLSEKAFQMRKNYLYRKLTIDTEDAAPSLGAMDPSMLSETLKRNLLMIASQMLLMAWVNYFFSGFVLVKLPFSLTLRFKTMLQRGIDLTDLDVAYVSSISWYFLNLFGLRGINSLVLGESLFGEEEMIKSQVSGMGAQRVDTKKLYQAEKEELDLLQHFCHLDEIEKQLLAKYPTRQ